MNHWAIFTLYLECSNVSISMQQSGKVNLLGSRLYIFCVMKQFLHLGNLAITLCVSATLIKIRVLVDIIIELDLRYLALSRV